MYSLNVYGPHGSSAGPPQEYLDCYDIDKLPNLWFKVSDLEEKKVFNDVTFQGYLINISNSQIKQGATLAMVVGIKADAVIQVLHKRSLKQQNKVKEVTLDMTGNR